jgi:hypothetical protein
MLKTFMRIALTGTMAVWLNGCSASADTGVYRPKPGVTWQWQLNGELNTEYDVALYDIDVFDTDTKTIQALHKAGKKVICYFSAGSYEEWREDAREFDAALLGKELDGWAGERWLDIRDTRLHAIMEARLDLAHSKGCDGVEPDNIDGYTNDTGFPLTAADQLTYNRYLAAQAHKRGLSIALKNDLNQIKELEPYFDFHINEQCHRYNECNRLQPFIDADKAVLNAEYARQYLDEANRTRLCQEANKARLSTLVLPMELDDRFRYDCSDAR